VLNPDENQPWRGCGYKVALADVAHNLKQAAATEKGFMESKWKPSVIVKVDGLTEEFSSKKGRRKLLDEYIDTNQAGEPWLIPAELFDVHQVKPLSLADLAISDVIQLDKRTVASILGIPPFVLGVGEFKRDAWNNFISSKLMPIAQIIQQTMTRGLLYKPEWYFRFNSRSLYNYDLKDLAAIADDQYVRGIMDGNEVRDWIGMSPREGLDELIILENYIPRRMIGDQSKLNGGK
jgi:HK97 family phage portal protein